MKMKNTTWCALTRSRFMRSQGRISTIEAPVVPMTLAARAPSSRKRAFSPGVARPPTPTWMPPATTNKEPIKAINAP